MGYPNETIMLLKVDLDCPCCYKKVKKLLCSIPQIKDQEYNKKQNTVRIRVVCCCPKKIRDKLRCKGGKSITCIEIIDPPKPPPIVPNIDPKPVKQDTRHNPDPTPLENPISNPVLEPLPPCCSDCREGRRTGPCYNGFRYGCGYGYGYGYGCPPPPPPPPPQLGGWWCYYDNSCPPGGYGYRPGYCASRCECYFRRRESNSLCYHVNA